MPTTGKILRVAALLLILSGLTALYPSRAQMQTGAPATVTLRVLDSYGKPLDYKVESFYAIGQPDVNLAAKFEGLTFKRAVQGNIYELRLVAASPGTHYPRIHQMIGVAEPSTLVVFSVPKPDLSGASEGLLPATTLVIQPMPRAEDVWANVRPAYGPSFSGTDTSETAVVNKDGTFHLHGTHGGLYIATIYQGSKIIRLAIVDIPQFAPEKAIEVRLN